MRIGFDSVDLKIVEFLGKYGPRNTTHIARELGIYQGTVRKRIKRMISKFFITFHARIYHTNIGLRKAFVFAEAIPGDEERLFDCLKANDFWVYVGPCYGRYEGYYAIYTVPNEHIVEFEQFVKQLEKTGVARKVQFFWSTSLQTVNSTVKWFNRHRGAWILPWNEWMREILTSKGTRLPYTLEDPKDFPLKGDYIDIFILKELEKDARVKLTKIAEMLDLTPEAVLYHYKKHIMERGLIEGFEVLFHRFDKGASDFSVFVFKFEDKEKMIRFALSLFDKPFVYTFGKILGENALIAHMLLPRPEYVKFKKVLSKLIKIGFLQTYEYIMEDFEGRARQTISYEFFKDGSWVYDHDEHLKRLHNLVSQTKSILIQNQSNN